MKANALFAVLLILGGFQSSTTWAQDSGLRLSYSDGRPDTVGVGKVNAVLRTVGVRVGTVALPKEAAPILRASHTRALNAEETKRLLSIFSLSRRQLLDVIAKAGRKPATPPEHRGGYLSISEEGVAPYPKVYDLKSLTPEVSVFLKKKFGKLHVNSAESGLGIDEVMTIVSGGPWTWFFVLEDDVVGKLTLGHVGLDGTGWRISYPGLGPHGGYLDAEYGLVVAYAHGPKKFVMRYEESAIAGEKTLGTNPWVDFSSETPKLKK